MKKRHSAEQIVSKLRQADVALGKGMKEMEKENARLKRLVADQALDIAILKEASRPNL